MGFPACKSNNILELLLFELFILLSWILTSSRERERERKKGREKNKYKTEAKRIEKNSEIIIKQ